MRAQSENEDAASSAPRPHDGSGLPFPAFGAAGPARILASRWSCCGYPRGTPPGRLNRPACRVRPAPPRSPSSSLGPPIGAECPRLCVIRGERGQLSMGRCWAMRSFGETGEDYAAGSEAGRPQLSRSEKRFEPERSRPTTSAPLIDNAACQWGLQAPPAKNSSAPAPVALIRPCGTFAMISWNCSPERCTRVR